MSTAGWTDILQRYDVIEDPVKLANGVELLCARVRDINALVDAIDEIDEDERLPYWACLWPSALALAEHVLVREWSPQASVLELGAGLGLCSVAAASKGARVTATDYEPDALAFCRRNAELNRVSLSTRILDWRHPPSGQCHDLILAADVLYEARKVEPVIDLVDALLAPGGRFVLADPGRPHLVTFEHKTTSQGWRRSRHRHGDVHIIEMHRD